MYKKQKICILTNDFKCDDCIDCPRLVKVHPTSVFSCILFLYRIKLKESRSVDCIKIGTMVECGHSGLSGLVEATLSGI